MKLSYHLPKDSPPDEAIATFYETRDDGSFQLAVEGLPPIDKAPADPPDPDNSKPDAPKPEDSQPAACHGLVPQVMGAVATHKALSLRMIQMRFASPLRLWQAAQCGCRSKHPQSFNSLITNQPCFISER